MRFHENILGRNLSWIFRENTIAFSEQLLFFRATICSNKISKFRWVLILSFLNYVYNMTQQFSFFKPEKWNWQKEFVSFHEIEYMYVPCKQAHT